MPAKLDWGLTCLNRDGLNFITNTEDHWSLGCLAHYTSQVYLDSAHRKQERTISETSQIAVTPRTGSRVNNPTEDTETACFGLFGESSLRPRRRPL